MASTTTVTWAGGGSSLAKHSISAVARLHELSVDSPVHGGELVGGFGQRFVDQCTRVAVETAPQLPPGLVQRRLHDQESIRSGSSLSPGADLRPFGGFPPHSCGIGPLQETDRFRDARHGFETVEGDLTSGKPVFEVGAPPPVTRRIVRTRERAVSGATSNRAAVHSDNDREPSLVAT